MRPQLFNWTPGSFQIDLCLNGDFLWLPSTKCHFLTLPFLTNIIKPSKYFGSVAIGSLTISSRPLGKASPPRVLVALRPVSSSVPAITTCLKCPSPHSWTVSQGTGTSHLEPAFRSAFLYVNRQPSLHQSKESTDHIHCIHLGCSSTMQILGPHPRFTNRLRAQTWDLAFLAGAPRELIGPLSLRTTELEKAGLLTLSEGSTILPISSMVRTSISPCPGATLLFRQKKS